MPRGPVHPRRAPGRAVSGGPSVARRARILLHRRVPGSDVQARPGSDRPPAPRQRRGALGGRARRAAAGGPLPGDDDRVGRPRPRLPPGLTGQDPGTPPRDPPCSGPSAHPVHDGSPRRDRREPCFAIGDAVGDRGVTPPVGTRAGGHRPELPPEAGHRDAVGSCLSARGAAGDDRPGPDTPTSRCERPGASQPERGARASPRCGTRRLGWHLSRDFGPREPRAAVARDRPPARGDGATGLRARSPAHDPSPIPARSRGVGGQRSPPRAPGPLRRGGIGA